MIDQSPSASFFHYRGTITSFLKDSKLYDCLSRNNQVKFIFVFKFIVHQVVVISQNLSLQNALDIFIEENIDEALFWNAENSTYEGIFTISDMINVFLRTYIHNTADQFNYNPSMVFQKKFRRFVQNEIEEENDLIEEVSQLQFGDEQSDICLTPLRQLDPGRKITENQKQMIINQLKNLTIKHWLSQNDESSLKLNGKLIKGQHHESLHDVCQRILKHQVHRIVVVDPDTKMIVAIIQSKDLLVFLIKELSHYLIEKEFQTSKMDTVKDLQKELQEQHNMEIRYFFQNKKKRKVIKYTFQTETVFYQMLDQQINSVPIVDVNLKFVGIIHKRDFLFILRGGFFDFLSEPIIKFYEYIKAEKKKLIMPQILTQQFFTMNQTVKEVVENLILSEEQILLCLDENQNIKEILTVTDIISFALSDD